MIEVMLVMSKITPLSYKGDIPLNTAKKFSLLRIMNNILFHNEKLLTDIHDMLGLYSQRFRQRLYDGKGKMNQERKKVRTASSAYSQRDCIRRSRKMIELLLYDKEIYLVGMNMSIRFSL